MFIHQNIETIELKTALLVDAGLFGSRADCRPQRNNRWMSRVQGRRNIDITWFFRLVILDFKGGWFFVVWIFQNNNSQTFVFPLDQFSPQLGDEHQKIAWLKAHTLASLNHYSIQLPIKWYWYLLCLNHSCINMNFNILVNTFATPSVSTARSVFTMISMIRLHISFTLIPTPRFGGLDESLKVCHCSTKIRLTRPWVLLGDIRIGISIVYDLSNSHFFWYMDLGEVWYFIDLNFQFKSIFPFCSPREFFNCAFSRHHFFPPLVTHGITVPSTRNIEDVGSTRKGSICGHSYLLGHVDFLGNSQHLCWWSSWSNDDRHLSNAPGMMAFCSIKATEYSGEVEKISHMPSGLSGHIVYKNHKKIYLRVVPQARMSEATRHSKVFRFQWYIRQFPRFTSSWDKNSPHFLKDIFDSIDSHSRSSQFSTPKK